MLTSAIYLAMSPAPWLSRRSGVRHAFLPIRQKAAPPQVLSVCLSVKGEFWAAKEKQRDREREKKKKSLRCRSTPSDGPQSKATQRKAKQRSIFYTNQQAKARGDSKSTSTFFFNLPTSELHTDSAVARGRKSRSEQQNSAQAGQVACETGRSGKK